MTLEETKKLEVLENAMKKMQIQHTQERPVIHGFMERSVRLGQELEDVIKKQIKNLIPKKSSKKTLKIN